MKKILALLGLLPLAVQAAVPLFDGVQSAENQLLTQSGRWFVSGENGVFEGRFDGRVYSKQRLTARLLNGQAHQCYFLGMTERQGRLYTVCTDNALNPFATKRLFVLNLADPAGELNEMFNPTDVALPNGLVTLPDGSLLLADSGAPLLPGKLLRFTVNAHGAVDGQSVYYRYVLNKPNGLKVDGQRLYVSLNPLTYAGLSQLRRYTLGAAGPQDGTVLYSSWGFLDDFALSSDGVVVAEFLAGRISHVSESGQVLRQADVAQPTSALLWHGAGVPAGDVTVTERGSGRLVRLAGFGAWPR
ncbi:hypothetical protein [Vogesella mureinivorans]|uniref:hypothetical protein n=1 Tax=Vogesella mureinivorans TaxID=657276 RepID=UPI0011C82A11|nr:hypothetical protein [Vogesella mureinivorans]